MSMSDYLRFYFYNRFIRLISFAQSLAQIAWRLIQMTDVSVQMTDVSNSMQITLIT